jgi:carboxypeptidase C (cathepsin A)
MSSETCAARGMSIVPYRFLSAGARLPTWAVSCDFCCIDRVSTTIALNLDYHHQRHTKRRPYRPLTGLRRLVTEDMVNSTETFKAAMPILEVRMGLSEGIWTKFYVSRYRVFQNQIVSQPTALQCGEKGHYANHCRNRNVKKHLSWNVDRLTFEWTCRYLATGEGQRDSSGLERNKTNSSYSICQSYFDPHIIFSECRRNQKQAPIFKHGRRRQSMYHR